MISDQDEDMLSYMIDLEVRLSEILVRGLIRGRIWEITDSYKQDFVGHWE